MDRETRIVETSQGKKVCIKTYLTYRELEPINAQENLTNEKKGVEILKVAIVNIDGSTEGIFDTLQDLPFKDFLLLSTEMKKVVGGDFLEAK